MTKHLAEIDLESAGPWWEGRKFKHPETSNEVGFKSLPLEEQKKLNSYVREHSPEKMVIPKKPIVPELKKEKPLEKMKVEPKAPGVEKVEPKTPEVEKVEPLLESEKLKNEVEMLKEKKKVKKLKEQVEKLKNEDSETKTKDKKKKIKDKQKKRKDKSENKEEFDDLMDGLLDSVDEKDVDKSIFERVLNKAYEEDPDKALELMYFFEHLVD